jgi:LysR family glycine cleavage system transcriptional activator
VVDFTREPFDVGIREGHGNWPGLILYALMDMEFTPFCSPDFLARVGKITTPSDLLKFPLLDWKDDWWPQWFKAADVPFSPPLGAQWVGFDSQVAIGQATLAGQGAAVLTPAYFAADIKAGRLVQLFPIISRSGTRLWLVYPEERAMAADKPTNKATVQRSTLGQPAQEAHTNCWPTMSNGRS